jgi:hypothetical protein
MEKFDGVFSLFLAVALTSKPRASARWVGIGKLLGRARACLPNADRWFLAVDDGDVLGPHARERTGSLRFARISRSVCGSVAYYRCSRGGWKA